MLNERIEADFSGPPWSQYRDVLQKLLHDATRGAQQTIQLPGPAAIQACLPPGATNQAGRRLQFVSADVVQPQEYETHIYETGEISTRKNSWHDLLNALVWSHFPSLKPAMNAVHYRELQAMKSGSQRGPVRDALTLLDESGVIIISRDDAVLDALATRDWSQAFVTHRAAWSADTSVLVTGHGLLEKFLQPYKAMTAHALLMRSADNDTLENRLGQQSRASIRKLTQQVDRQLATQLMAGEILCNTSELVAVPVMGIPGWCRAIEQDHRFYQDTDVFRPPGPHQARPMIIELEVNDE